jgi:hypothetical protein
MLCCVSLLLRLRSYRLVILLFILLFILFFILFFILCNRQFVWRTTYESADRTLPWSEVTHLQAARRGTCLPTATAASAEAAAAAAAAAAAVAAAAEEEGVSEAAQVLADRHCTRHCTHRCSQNSCSVCHTNIYVSFNGARELQPGPKPRAR